LTTYNNGIGNVYLNGNLEGSTTFNSGAFANNSQPVIMGNSAENASNLLTPSSADIIITNTSIWNVVLTSSEINALSKYFSPYKVRASSLVSFVVRDLDIIQGIPLFKTNTAEETEPRVFLGIQRTPLNKKYPVFPSFPAAPEIFVSPTSDTTVSVSVSASPPTGTTIGSYLVQRSLTSTGWIDETTGTNSNSYEDFSLAPSTTYYYRAKYTLTDGRVSPWSTVKSVTTAQTETPTGDPLAPLMTAISSLA
jgi:hypothetical protein